MNNTYTSGSSNNIN